MTRESRLANILQGHDYFSGDVVSPSSNGDDLVHGLKLALTSGVALFVCVAPAKAEQWWVVIQKDSDGSLYLADSNFSPDNLSQTKTFWTHVIYDMPRYGMKSLKVEYTVHCTNRTIMTRRYIEYDADDNVAFSGTSTNDKSPQLALPGSAGDRLLTFACSSESVRKQAYFEVSEDAGYRKSGVVYAEPREIVSTPMPAPATKMTTNIADNPQMVPSIYRYRDCVLQSARRLATLQDTASKVASAAVSNCLVSRVQVAATYATSQSGSFEQRREYILSIDKRMQFLAEGEVAKLRSK